MSKWLREIIELSVFDVYDAGEGTETSDEGAGC